MSKRKFNVEIAVTLRLTLRDRNAIDAHDRAQKAARQAAKTLEADLGASADEMRVQTTVDER